MNLGSVNPSFPADTQPRICRSSPRGHPGSDQLRLTIWDLDKPNNRTYIQNFKPIAQGEINSRIHSMPHCRRWLILGFTISSRSCLLLSDRPLLLGRAARRKGLCRRIQSSRHVDTNLRESSSPARNPPPFCAFATLTDHCFQRIPTPTVNLSGLSLSPRGAHLCVWDHSIEVSYPSSSVIPQGLTRSAYDISCAVQAFDSPPASHYASSCPAFRVIAISECRSISHRC